MKALSSVLLLFSASCVYYAEDRGYVSVAWELEDPSGRAVGCFANETFRITLGNTSFDYPCSDGAAITTRIPSGSYMARFELFTADGVAQSVTRPVNVYGGTTTEVGMIVFTVDAPIMGSATFTWDLHAYDLSAPGEACAPGETLYFEIGTLEPFRVDCAAYGSQPVTDMPAGRYEAIVTLEYNGEVEDDPRPGFGDAVVAVTFDVAAGLDTPVHLDFVVASGAGREARTQGPAAPAQKYPGRPAL